MANKRLAAALDTRWMRASELNAQLEQVRHFPLEVQKLNSFIPNGLTRGSLTEITGLKSSGIASTSLYILAESLCRGEVCACVDLNNQFNPASLAQLGVSLDNFSWIRCQGNTEHAIRSADLLLHAGGFGIVLLDLYGAAPQALNRIPLSYWFRFQRAIEDTPTILLICGEYPQARSCSRHSLEIKARKFHWSGDANYSILKALEVTAIPRKTMQGKAKVTSIRPEALLIPAAVA